MNTGELRTLLRLERELTDSLEELRKAIAVGLIDVAGQAERESQIADGSGNAVFASGRGPLNVADVGIGGPIQ